MAARDTKALIVKVSHGNEIRRFSANADALTWSSLAKNTASLFGLSACASASLKLTYLDDENDRVTISSDAELAEAVELALAAAPPVLRLALLAKPATNDSTSQAHVPTADASTAADKPPTAEAGNMTKPRTAEAASHATRPPTAEAGNMTNKQADTHGSAAPPYTPHAAGGAPPMAAYPNEEMAAFFSTLARQLPTLVAQLPPGVRSLLPHAELDVAATLAANAAANASCAAAAAANDVAAAAAAAAAAPPPANGAPEDKEPAGVHVGVTCDRSGVCPIVGWRYHLVGHNYDLAQSEYDKLDDKEKALYQRLPPPPTPYTHTIGAEANNNNASQGVHPGVECDRSGLCPIVGMRYNLRGHNYDLCQAEFDKLPANERLLYTPIPPPDGNGNSNNNNAQAPPWRGSAGQWGGGRGWGGGGRWGGGGGGGCGFAGGNGGTGGGGGWGGAAKLAARFVRDVTVFDGTQMNPDTPFTKIWRLKNTGEVAWPPGTRMLFVGGDQMSTEMSVPLSRASAVLPGEEVDVAVEMVAPQALGRYLGYWRLVGPHGRRKFGQRVWCHVQVVDPAEGAPPLMTEADLDRTRREIESKKSALAADETDADPADDPPPTPTPTPDVTDGVTPEDPMDLVTAAPPTVTDVTDEAAERGSSDDEAIVVTEAMALEAKGATADVTNAVTAGGVTVDGVTVDGVTADGPQTVGGVAEALGQMGFTDTALVQVALEKHGADLSACARDLAQSSEWESLLSDLEEMGFQNRQLNKSLLLKHSGNVKQTVRALVEDA